MSAIGETPWDDELMTDRVNVMRNVARRTASGQSNPEPTPIHLNVPCKINRRGVIEDVSGVARQATDRVDVEFAEDVEAKTGDILVPVFPSVGSNIRVGSYSFDTTVRLYIAVGTQTS